MELKDIRRACGMTQDYAAQKMGVLQSSISQWESGTTYPHPSRIPKLADLYKVTEGEIIAACNAAHAQRQENSA